MGIRIRGKEEGIYKVSDERETNESGVNVPASKELFELRVKLIDERATVCHIVSVVIWRNM